MQVLCTERSARGTIEQKSIECCVVSPECSMLHDDHLCLLIRLFAITLLWLLRSSSLSSFILSWFGHFFIVFEFSRKKFELKIAVGFLKVIKTVINKLKFMPFFHTLTFSQQSYVFILCSQQKSQYLTT
jgi:hypothetical protein